MTLSPVENYHAVKPRPDLGSYPLNSACPIFKGVPATEDHHCFRRSLGAGFRESFFVELADGAIIPHRIALSANAHRLVTNNEIWIRWDEEDKSYAWLEKNDDDEWEFVDYITYFPGFPDEDTYAVGGHEKFETKVEWITAPTEPSPGSTCSLCRRRVPHPKKPSSPKTKVFSVRVPLDEVEPWEEALDAAASHLGLGTAPHHRFQTLNAGIALILQGPKGLLE